MRYGTLIFALGALSSSQVSAGEFQSVYVAPGGVYIASGQVYVRPGNVDSPYIAPGRSTLLILSTQCRAQLAAKNF